MKRCYLSPAACRDLDEISEYFLSVNLEAGERILQEFAQKCESLIKFPNLGRNYTSIRPEMRGIPLEGYIIFYQVVDDGIEILRVLYGRRNLPDLFNEER